MDDFFTTKVQYVAHVFNDAGEHKTVLLMAVNEWEAKQAFYARNAGWYVSSISRRS